MIGYGVDRPLTEAEDQAWRKTTVGQAEDMERAMADVKRAVMVSVTDVVATAEKIARSFLRNL